MESNRPERDEGHTAVSNSERLLRDGPRIATAWNTAIPVGSPPMVPQI